MDQRQHTYLDTINATVRVVSPPVSSPSMSLFLFIKPIPMKPILMTEKQESEKPVKKWFSSSTNLVSPLVPV